MIFEGEGGDGGGGGERWESNFNLVTYEICSKSAAVSEFLFKSTFRALDQYTKFFQKLSVETLEQYMKFALNQQ